MNRFLFRCQDIQFYVLLAPQHCVRFTFGKGDGKSLETLIAGHVPCIITQISDYEESTFDVAAVLFPSLPSFVVVPIHKRSTPTINN